MKKLLSFLAILATIAVCAANPPTSIRPQSVKDGEIKVDGTLNETVWQQAPSYGKFSILRYAERAASESTLFQTAVSPSGIYWAFRIQDQHTVATVKNHGETVGKVGIVGPKRMDYSKVLTALQEAINDMTEEERL